MNENTKMKGGLILDAKKDHVPVLLQPGVTHVSRETQEKYGRKFLEKLNTGTMPKQSLKRKE